MFIANRLMVLILAIGVAQNAWAQNTPQPDSAVAVLGFETSWQRGEIDQASVRCAQGIQDRTHTQESLGCYASILNRHATQAGRGWRTLTPSSESEADIVRNRDIRPAIREAIRNRCGEQRGYMGLTRCAQDTARQYRLALGGVLAYAARRVAREGALLIDEALRAQGVSSDMMNSALQQAQRLCGVEVVRIPHPVPAVASSAQESCLRSSLLEGTRTVEQGLNSALNAAQAFSRTQYLCENYGVGPRGQGGSTSPVRQRSAARPCGLDEDWLQVLSGAQEMALAPRTVAAEDLAGAPEGSIFGGQLALLPAGGIRLIDTTFRRRGAIRILQSTGERDAAAARDAMASRRRGRVQRPESPSGGGGDTRPDASAGSVNE